MPGKYTAFVSALLALTLAGCTPSEPPPPQREAVPVADSPSASLVSVMPPPDARTLRFRVRAPNTHPLYLDHCNGAFSWGLEHEVSGIWKPAWIVATNACHSDPIVIPAGESLEFTEALTLQPGERLPAGTYRLAIYGLYSAHHPADHAASTEVPHNTRVSAPLALPPRTSP